jgi:hypothetical protein
LRQNNVDASVHVSITSKCLEASNGGANIRSTASRATLIAPAV